MLFSYTFAYLNVKLQYLEEEYDYSHKEVLKKRIYLFSKSLQFNLFSLTEEYLLGIIQF